MSASDTITTRAHDKSGAGTAFRLYTNNAAKEFFLAIKCSRFRIDQFFFSLFSYIDFKDAETLAKFQTEKGKIMPRRITGTCLDHQKMLATAVKRARIIALVY